MFCSFIVKGGGERESKGKEGKTVILAKDQRRGKSRMRREWAVGRKYQKATLRVRNLFLPNPQPEAFPENKVTLFFPGGNIMSRGSDADLIQGSLEDITGWETLREEVCVPSRAPGREQVLRMCLLNE